MNFMSKTLKATRPEEYKLWLSLIQKDDFSFDGLYTFFNALLVPQGHGAITSVLQYSKGRVESLEETIKKLRERIVEYELTVEGLSSDIDKSDTAISYLVNLLADVNSNLYRLTNNLLDFNDLRFVTPFTVYILKGNILEKYMDVGTSGASPDKIDITVPRNPEYAVVVAVNNVGNEAFVNNPYSGRNVVAFSMKMMEESRFFLFDVESALLYYVASRKISLKLMPITHLYTHAETWSSVDINPTGLI
jgi:hypothetical protein